MPLTTFFSVALSVAVAASPAPLPRLIVSLQRQDPGKIIVRVENAASKPLALGARTFLSLSLQADAAPVYWAEVNTPKLPTVSTPMLLAGKQKRNVPLELRALLWSPDRSGLGAGHTLARGVRPGQYQLQVQIIDERGASWISGGLPITVLQGGGIAR
jgi:hypothetical protein